MVWSAVRCVGVMRPSPPRRLSSLYARGVPRAGEGGRRRQPELARRAQDERLHLAPLRAQRDRDQADRILPPFARTGAGDVIDAHQGSACCRTVVDATGQDGRGRALAERDAPRLQVPVRELVEVFGEEGIESRRLRRPELHHRVVRRLRDGDVEAGGALHRGKAGVATEVVAGDGVHGVEHGDVDDRESLGLSAGAELLAEDARIAGGRRGVIERRWLASRSRSSAGGGLSDRRRSARWRGSTAPAPRTGRRRWPRKRPSAGSFAAAAAGIRSLRRCRRQGTAPSRIRGGCKGSWAVLLMRTPVSTQNSRCLDP